MKEQLIFKYDLKEVTYNVDQEKNRRKLGKSNGELEKHDFDTGRNSRPEVFCKKGALKNFAKFKEKHLCQSSFFNKVAGLRPAYLSIYTWL